VELAVRANLMVAKAMADVAPAVVTV